MTGNRYLLIFTMAVSLMFHVITNASAEVRENMGIYGGYVLDYAYDQVNDKVFAAVEGPLSLFVSSDSGQSWNQAFPDDSLSWMEGADQRGWAGRGVQISTENGMTAVITVEQGGVLSSAAITTDGENWHTLFDAVIGRELKDTLVRRIGTDLASGYGSITYVHILDGIVYAAWNNIVLISSDTGKSWDAIPFPDASAYNHSDNERYTIKKVVPTGISDSVFYVLAAGPEDGDQWQIYVTEDRGTFTQIPVVDTTGIIGTPKRLSSDKEPSEGREVNVIIDLWVDPVSPDTMVAHEFDNGTDGMHAAFLSVDGGQTWKRIIANSPGQPNLEEITVFQDESLPGPDHVRLVGGYLYSDNLGETWQQAPGYNSGDLSNPQAISGHISNTDCYLGYRSDGPYVSKNGFGGPWVRSFDGMASVTVNQVAQNPDNLDRVYLATRSGIAMTTAFTDSTMDNTEKWKEPYGNYPIQPSGEANIQSIMISPYDSLLVIAGGGNGLYRTTSGGMTDNDWEQIAHDQITGLDASGLMSNGGTAQSIAFYSPDSVFAAFSAARDAVGGLALSTDGGASWEVKTGYPSGPCRVVTIAENSTTGEKVIYVGTGYGTTSPGRIYRSSDGGASWDSIIGPNAYNSSATELPIRDIAVRPGSTDTLYIAANDDNLDWAICYSFNGGDSLRTVDTWMNYGMEVSSIAINKYHPDSVFFAARTKVLLLDFTEIDELEPLPGEEVASEEMVVIDESWPRLMDYFEGLPGETINDLYFDDLVMTSSVGFFAIKGGDEGTGISVDGPVPDMMAVNPLRATLRRNARQLIVGLTLQNQAAVAYRVYSIDGRMVMKAGYPTVAAGQCWHSFDLSALSRGLYCLDIHAGNERIRRSFMIVR